MKTLHSPLPQAVTVANWPSPDVTSLHWAEAGVFVSLVAAAIGLITLLRVNRQIALANDALILAKDELKATSDTLELAKTELDLTSQGLAETRRSNKMVEESLEYTRAQQREVAKRARLEAFSLLPLPGNYPRNQTMWVSLHVLNCGNKGASSALLRLLLPPGIIPDAGSMITAGWRTLPTWNSGTAEYSMFECDLSQPMFPKTVVKVHTLQFTPVGNPTQRALYQIVYEDGATPEDGSFGVLRWRNEIDSAEILVGLPPF